MAFDARVVVGEAPALGDQALRFRFLMPTAAELGDHDVVREYTFVRVGSTTATFETNAIDTARQFPAGLIEKQIQRLREAQQS